MKIITLNIWGRSGPFEKRWDFFLSELQKLNSDLICLQEVFDSELTTRIQNQFHFKYAHSSIPSGLVIISKFELSAQKTIAYKTQSPTETEPRCAIMANVKIGKNEIQIGNTHLSWKPEDEPVRVGQTKELIEAVQKEMTVLAGDFNDVPESRTISELKRAGFQDTYEVVHRGGKDLTWDNENPYIQTHKEKFPDRRIDFLLFHKTLLKQMPLKKCGIVFNHPNSEDVYPSDHYGVLVEI